MLPLKLRRALALLLLCALLPGLAACGRTEGSYRILKTLGSERFQIGFRADDYVASYVVAALEVLSADGTVQAAALRWFGEDRTSVRADADALAALPEPPARTLIMGVDPKRFPMSYAVGEEQFSGFDVELAEAVCRLLGWTLRCQPVQSGNAYVELSSGNVDCIWGGAVLADVNLDEEGKELPEGRRITVTPAYLENDIVLVTRADSGYGSAGSLRGTALMLDADARYVDALERKTGLMNRFGTVERVTGGALQCFAALDAADCQAIVTDSTAVAARTRAGSVDLP